MGQDQTRRGCILQPNVAVAATLGAGIKFDRVNRNGVALVLKAGVFHLRLYASRPQPFPDWGNRCLQSPKVAATAHRPGIKSLTGPATED